MLLLFFVFFFFFFNDTATTEIYTLSLHDALPILVQALQHDPEVVILDEPTEGLDPLVQETFFALVGETSEAGRTVFLSSHVLSEVQRACRRVAIVRAGRLVTVEAVAALREARARRLRLGFPDGYDHGR